MFLGSLRKSFLLINADGFKKFLCLFHKLKIILALNLFPSAYYNDQVSVLA